MGRLHYWAVLIGDYYEESGSFRDFLRVMRVRLAMTPAGRVLARRPYETAVTLRRLGRVRVRSHTSDIGVLEELLSARNYSHLPVMPVASVVDLGANTGLAARWWHHEFPGARMVCVEPEPGNVRMLRENAAPGTVVIEACVGGSERTVGLSAASGDWSWRIDGPGHTRVITMRTVLETAGLDRIGLLKCDIEGAEVELFEDCAAWIGGVDALVVECHGDFHASDLEACVARGGGRFRRVYLEENPAYECETVTMVRI